MKALVRALISPAGLVIWLLVALALAAPLLWPDPRGMGTDLLAPPSWEHPFGTTLLGQDVFGQTAHALRVDLVLGVAAVLVSLLIGVLLGGTA
ncbi:MAG: ABC transporter, partial [Microbacterium sp.]